jgi:AcrR family transcriptional regulator
MKADKRRKHIMLRAEALFASKRFHEITMDDVALAARVGKGTIYRYFENKEDLYTQTVVSGLDEMSGLLERKVPWGDCFMVQITEACGLLSEFYYRRISLFRMIQTEEIRFSEPQARYHRTWSERNLKLLLILERIILNGIEEGAVRNDIPPLTLGRFLLGMMRTRVRHMDSIPEDLRGNEILVDLFLNGAAVSGGNLERKGEKRLSD